jgi:PPOX class probable F420-dependent enzyme
MVQQDTEPAPAAAPMEAAMSRERMELFLREPIVAVLSWVTSKGRVASSPVWFEYRAGKFFLHVMTESSKARAMLANPSMSLCIQDPEPPYRYVTVSGMARVIEDSSKEALALDRRLARRYLGRIGGNYYLEKLYPTFPGESRLVEIEPAHISSIDGTAAMNGVALMGMRTMRRLGL